MDFDGILPRGGECGPWTNHWNFGDLGDDQFGSGSRVLESRYRSYRVGGAFMSIDNLVAVTGVCMSEVLEFYLEMARTCIQFF